MNTLLIGPRAAGKSIVGPALARHLRQSFVELDDLALTSIGLPSVTDVWARLGESAWRDAEAACFEKAMRDDDQVIALGGGAPMIDRVRQAIVVARARRMVFVVYLSCDAGELQRRLGLLERSSGASGSDRPSLTGMSTVDEVPVVLAQRRATYESLADLKCVTTGRKPEEVAHEIAASIRARIG